jgi:hypothetical protein
MMPPPGDHIGRGQGSEILRRKCFIGVVGHALAVPRAEEAVGKLPEASFHVTPEGSFSASRAMRPTPSTTWRMLLALIASRVIPPAFSKAAACSKFGSGNTRNGYASLHWTILMAVGIR